MLNNEKTMEIWEKVPIVVPKVAFLGTFGTTIGTYTRTCHRHVSFHYFRFRDF